MNPMKYHLLGKSGLRVSELCLGTMTFGEEWGWGASKEECHKIFNAYVDAGGNFIDTANNYTEGTNPAVLNVYYNVMITRFSSLKNYKNLVNSS